MEMRLKKIFISMIKSNNFFVIKHLLLLFITILFSCGAKNTQDDTLRYFVEEVNKKCPYFVDEITRLDYAEIDENGFFHYVYSFPSISKKDIDINQFYTNQREILYNVYQTNPEVSFFKENNIVTKYTYNDKYNFQITSIVIP